VVPDFAWPGLGSDWSAKMMALLFQFQQSERLPPAELAARQFLQLRRLVAACHESAPFQRNRLLEAGIHPDTELTPEVWRRLKPVTRYDIQGNGDQMRATKLDGAHGPTAAHSTSGSTGSPVTVIKTALESFVFEAVAMRDLLWHGADFSASLGILRRDPLGNSGPPDGHAIPAWGHSPQELFGTGPAAMLDIRTPTAEQVTWLARMNPAYVLSTPSNLTLVAQQCRATGTSLPGLRLVRTYGEVVSDEFRELCQEVWGVSVADAYSAQEVGYLALQCPGTTHYHVMSETMLVEVLDEQGVPCRPGGIGRVVVTPLHNFAMPLLRYDIGDFAQVGPQCACGRSLPVLMRILGRERNRLALPSGEKRYAYIGAKYFSAVSAVVQYQVVQTSLERIEIRLVLRRLLTGEEERYLRELVQNGLGHAFEVEIVVVDQIERAASGKYEDFRSEVG